MLYPPYQNCISDAVLMRGSQHNGKGTEIVVKLSVNPHLNLDLRLAVVISCCSCFM